MRSHNHQALRHAVGGCTSQDAIRRVAMLSMHTSPLAQPGTGDAGGMNVYIMRTAERLAAANVEVEIFTRATSSEQPVVSQVRPGITVHHVPAGPFEGLSKNDLPSQTCAFTTGVLRAEAAHPAGHFDVIHSHYWLSGQAGWLARERWGVPLVFSAHTLAKVKNRHLAVDDTPEPFTRVVGEQQVIDESDAVVTNTASESAELAELYAADPAKLTVAPPGVDTAVFRPGDRAAARRTLDLPPDALVLGFAGRIQPLKAPDVLLKAADRLRRMDSALAERLRIVIIGGPSGSGTERPKWLEKLAADLGLSQMVTFLPPRSGEALATAFRACDLVCVPSYNETFGLVAVEAQACGVPVVAAAVGGLTTAVAEDRGGTLVNGHDPGDWAATLRNLLHDDQRRQRLAAGAREHAKGFTWHQTATGLLQTYRAAVRRRRTARAADRRR